MGTGGHSCISPAGPFLSPGAFTRHRPSGRSTGHPHSLALGSLRSRCGRFRPRREPIAACSPSRVLTGWSRALGCLPRPSGARVHDLIESFTCCWPLLRPSHWAGPQRVRRGTHSGPHTRAGVMCCVWCGLRARLRPHLHVESGDSHRLSLKRPLP